MLHYQLDARKFTHLEVVRTSRIVIAAGICFHGEYSRSVFKIPSLLARLHDLE
jgi:hypothetical protein